MPGTVQDLSRKLLNAIDSEGNVTDMVIVLEVVEALEGIPITADDIRINGLGRNINQLRRKLPDSNKSLAKRLKKLVKAWQQLIQRQTPNGLSAPSLAGAAGAPTITANNKPEQSSANDEQQPQQSNVTDSRQRRKSISSSSREGTPSRSSTTMVGESLASKSSHPPPPPIATATAAAGGTTHLQTNTSRTPTPTPSPHPPPPATPTSSSLSTSSTPQVPPVPSSVAGSTPQTAAVIPRPTKAQDFARNRIRRMQMLAQVTPQSHKPVAAIPQAPFPAATAAAMSTTTSSMANEQQPKSQEANASQQQRQSGGEISQSLASQQQLPPPVTCTESFHNASSVKGTGLVSQSDHSLATSSPVQNGSHFKAAAGTMAAMSDSKSSSKSSLLSSSSNKFISAHSRSTPSLSQIVTNSFNHDPPPPPPSSSSYLAESHLSSISPPPISTSTSVSSLSTTIAHKVGVKGSQERGTSSQERLTETPSPAKESLVVQIPRNLVHISRRNHEFREAKGLHHLTDRQGLSSDLEEFSLTVSIDLSILHQFSNSRQAIGGSLEDIKRNRTEWFVKEGHHIPENSLHKFGDASEPMETDTITSFGSGGISHVPTFTSSGHFTAFGGGMGIPHLPTSGPRLVPSGASPGVDGCMGSDGYWYSWTDSIPGHDVSVTVLPYIYVDDDESDAMEVFTN